MNCLRESVNAVEEELKEMLRPTQFNKDRETRVYPNNEFRVCD